MKLLEKGCQNEGFPSGSLFFFFLLLLFLNYLNNLGQVISGVKKITRLSSSLNLQMFDEIRSKSLKNLKSSYVFQSNAHALSAAVWL